MPGVRRAFCLRSRLTLCSRCLCPCCPGSLAHGAYKKVKGSETNLNHYHLSPTPLIALLTTAESLANHAIPPNSAGGEPATLKTHLQLSSSGPISDIQHNESLPQCRERSIRVGIIGFRTRQSNSPDCQPAGGARLSGNGSGPFVSAFSFRWSRILLITTGSSMQAMILTGPPQAWQVSMSILNTRFNRCAHVMAA